jgi:hypothetical protein
MLCIVPGVPAALQARDVVAQRTADVKAAQDAAQKAKAEAQRVAQTEAKEREKRAAEQEGRKVAAAARNKAVQVGGGGREGSMGPCIRSLLPGWTCMQSEH